MSLLIVIVVLVAIAILLYFEYSQQDCIATKACPKAVADIDTNGSVIDNIDTIREMVKQSTDYTYWRIALIVALILPAPIMYVLKGRLPTVTEYLIIGAIIFLGTYLSAGWLHAHYSRQFTVQADRNLTMLKDKLATNKDLNNNSSLDNRSLP